MQKRPSEGYKLGVRSKDEMTTTSAIPVTPKPMLKKQPLTPVPPALKPK